MATVLYQAKQPQDKPRQPPSGLNTVDFNADSAYRHIATQVELGPRIPGTVPHAACVEYIAGRLRSYGADTVMIQQSKVDSPSGGVIPVSNILARYNPGTGRRILLVAHYDTRPWADNDPNAANHSTPVPGANDDASGVGSVLLELARLMSERNTAAGVDLLFVDAEDSGNDGDENSWCLGTQGGCAASHTKAWCSRPMQYCLIW